MNMLFGSSACLPVFLIQTNRNSNGSYWQDIHLKMNYQRSHATKENFSQKLPYCCVNDRLFNYEYTGIFLLYTFSMHLEVKDKDPKASFSLEIQSNQDNRHLFCTMNFFLDHYDTSWYKLIILMALQ